MKKDKLEEEIISKALKCQGIIPDTRVNIILCRKVIELTRKEDFEIFEKMIDEVENPYPKDVFRWDNKEKLDFDRGRFNKHNFQIWENCKEKIKQKIGEILK